MEEEKKMKTVEIEVFGYEQFLEPKDGDDMVFDAYSRYAYYEMVFHVDGKEYTPDDFSPAEDILSPEQLKEFKDFDVMKFFEDSGAYYGMCYINKAWTTIEIEIPQDEEFDPKKAAVVVREYLYVDPDVIDPDTVCAFAYDGKVYRFGIEYSDGISGKLIWKRREWGFIDKSGKWVIEPKFKEANPFSDGLALVCSKSNGLYGFIDRSGAWVIEPKYTTAYPFSDGLARVCSKSNGLFGFIDRSGAWVIEPTFEDPINNTVRGREELQDDYARDFSDGLALVRSKSNGLYGFIDRSGAWVIEPQYDYARDFSEGLASVEVNGKYGYIDKTGVFVINPDFGIGYSFSDGLAFVRKKHDGKIEIGCIDHSGAWVFFLTPDFKAINAFSDGLAYAESVTKKGFVNDTGEWVIETKFDVVGDFHEGVACVNIDGKAGFIDKTGNLIIEPQFESVERNLMRFTKMRFEGDYRFSEGLAPAIPWYKIPELEDDDDEYYYDYDE